MIPMRDGVNLHVKVFLPAMIPFRPVPAVLVRSPYGDDATELIADLFIPFGFAAVGEDMRGTHQSEGNFTLWHDSNDALDTMEWIANQGWSNGRVYTAGASADGIAQFAEALENPPRLHGQFIIVASSQGYEVIFPGGTYRQLLTEHWLHDTVPKQAETLIDRAKVHEGAGPYWDALNFTGHYGEVTYPSVQWGGWYDIFAKGSVDGFNGYQQLSAPVARGRSYMVMDPLGHCEAAASAFPSNRVLLPVQLAVALFQHEEKNAKGADTKELPGGDLGSVLSTPSVTFYVMGPVTANLTAEGPVAMPPPSSPHGEAWSALVGDAKRDLSAWKNSDEAADDQLGNYWTSVPDWPQPTPTNYYLHADGSLSTEAPAASAACASEAAAVADASCSTSFVFDPSDPVPTVGGNNLFGSCGPWDQSSLEGRPDVRVWTSAPMTEPLAFTGQLYARLWVFSNATDTDFMVKLNIVYPDDRSVLLADSAFRMRWREANGEVPTALRGSGGARRTDGLDWPPAPVPPAAPMQNGKLYQIDVDLWPKSVIVNPGYRLRLVVSSSNAPRFGVNPNNGLPLIDASQGPLVVAENGVAHTATYASHLELPVVSLDQIPKNDAIHKSATPEAAALASKYVRG